MSEDNLVWKLVDKEGYFSENCVNKTYYSEYFIGDIITLSTIDVYGNGIIIGEEAEVIGDFEFKYFETVDVHSTTQPVNRLWDGTSTLGVGDIVTKVNSHNTKLTVELIKGDQVVLTNETGHLSVLMLDNINSLLPSPKEQFCDLMLNKVRSQSLDFAYDTSWDIKELSKWCYEELMERK